MIPESRKRTKKDKKFRQRGDNLASDVTITFEPKYIKNVHRERGDLRTEEQKRIDEANGISLESQSLGTKQSGMGLNASMGKDERKFKLQALINKKEVVTLQSAMQALGLAKGTVITYLREIDYQMWDAKDKKFVGAKEGKKVGLDE